MGIGKEKITDPNHESSERFVLGILVIVDSRFLLILVEIIHMYYIITKRLQETGAYYPARASVTDGNYLFLSRSIFFEWE